VGSRARGGTFLSWT